MGYDMDLLQARMRQLFPDALVKLGQLREHLVVEGQARSSAQVSEILQVLDAYLTSMERAGAVAGGVGAGDGVGGSGVACLHGSR